MLSKAKFFEPQRNSMAMFIELSREAKRQEALQERDKIRRPYDIWAQGKGLVCSVPPCLKAMDYLVVSAVNGEDME